MQRRTTITYNYNWHKSACLVYLEVVVGVTEGSLNGGTRGGIEVSP